MLVGFVLRLRGITWGLPYLYDPDEHFFVDPAVRIVTTGDLNPHWFGHPGSTVIDLLGLDSVRESAFTRTYEETMRKIRAAEERHASAKKDGKITAITVSPFPDEGKALAREWSQQLDALLSPAEREKYRKYSMERSLFPMGLEQLGAEERTITITRTGNSYSVSESVATGRGGGWTRSATGNESIVAPYSHLMNPEGGR